MVVDITLVMIIIYTIIFSYIAVTKKLISCNNPIDYKSLANYVSFIIQKVVVKRIIILIIEEITMEREVWACFITCWWNNVAISADGIS